MTKEDSSKKQEEPKKSAYKLPTGKSRTAVLKGQKSKLTYKVITEWLPIRRKEKIIADIFYTYYFVEGKKNRPITYVFNGGPGASSVYLHVGALGPKTVHFEEKGTTPAPPAKLEDNPHTWLEFTDLVFVDPIGTGFSRSLEEVDLSPAGAESKEKNKKSFGQEFYKMNRDLESIGEFIQRFLSKYRRWSSPIYVAGESYGGFRAARLSKKLQEDYGVGLKGLILISPSIELYSLTASDYDLLYWIESFPSMAATAFYHGKSYFFKKEKFKHKAPFKSLLKPAESFALNELNSFLVQGESMPPARQKEILKKAVNFIGVPLEKLEKSYGRMSLFQFCRLLLAEEKKWCGLYDGSVATHDPFPDRESFEGPDPALSGNEHIFAHGINILLRDFMRIDSERQYRLLNIDVNKNWKDDTRPHFFELKLGACDDLRYAMSLNPFMKVFICHGVFDLVTPYFSSERLIHLMKLPKELKDNISFKVYPGGHMFYTWAYSKKLFKDHIKKIYA